MCFKKVFWIASIVLVLSVYSASAADFTVGSVNALQNALDTAKDNGENDTINIKPGTYNIGTALTYIPTEDTDLVITGTQPDSIILDGKGSNQILYIDTSRAGGDDNSEIQLLQLTFQNGKNDLGNGGAAYIKTSKAELAIEHCKFLNNSADFGSGGGLCVVAWRGDVLLDGNTFIDNSSANGGGFYVYSDATNSQIKISILNNIIVNNTTTVNGGGAWVGAFTFGQIYMINNTCTDNSASNDGGGLYIETRASSEAYVYNNIIFNNTAGNDGSDIYFYDFATSAYFEIFNNNFSEYAFFHRDIDLQVNNINQDPLLDQDYHLSSGSICINTGNNNALKLPSHDFDGDNRIIGGTVDLGADESTSGLLMYSVNFSELSNGYVDGLKSQQVGQGDNCQQVTAIPDSGYVFDEWTGDYTGSDNPLTVKNVSSDMDIVASFTVDQTGSQPKSSGGGGGCFIDSILQ